MLDSPWEQCTNYLPFFLPKKDIAGRVLNEIHLMRRRTHHGWVYRPETPEEAADRESYAAW